MHDQQGHLQQQYYNKQSYLILFMELSGKVNNSLCNNSTFGVWGVQRCQAVELSIYYKIAVLIL
jgi:hypothetical protein